MAANHSKFLDDLNSKYTCLFEPLPPGADPGAGRTDRSYLTSLRVYGNRDDVDDKPLPTSKSRVIFYSRNGYLFIYFWYPKP